MLARLCVVTIRKGIDAVAADTDAVSYCTAVCANTKTHRARTFVMAIHLRRFVLETAYCTLRAIHRACLCCSIELARCTYAVTFTEFLRRNVLI